MTFVLYINELPFFFQVSRYKIPEHVVIVDDFPKTATGKIQKFQLRENVIELLKHSTKGN